MFNGGCPWDGEHDGRSPQKPSQRYLRGARTMCVRDSTKHLASNFACSEWKPGNKSNSVTLTIIHNVVPFTVGKAVAILHGDDWGNSARSLDMLLCDVGQSDQANLAFFSQSGQSFHRSVEGYGGVWNVQLVNVDAVQAQSLEAALHRFAKVRRCRIVGPLIRAGTVPASVGR